MEQQCCKQIIMKKRILIILTSQGTLGKSSRKTGWYLPELAHPLKVLFDAGYSDLIDSVSPEGGKAPVDPVSAEAFKDDETCQWLQHNVDAQKLINCTKKPGEVNSRDYRAALYPGGHGPMFDLAYDETVANITSDIYQNGGIVAACCHGPAGLVPVKGPNGNPIVQGQQVTSFTNTEEDAIEMTSFMPFSLEMKLRELGGSFTHAEDFQENIVIDGKLLTGQNSQSSHAFAQAFLRLLELQMKEQSGV